MKYLLMYQSKRCMNTGESHPNFRIFSDLKQIDDYIQRNVDLDVLPKLFVLGAEIPLRLVKNVKVKQVEDEDVFFSYSVDEKGDHMDKCPTCDEMYATQCRCPKSDRTCPSGHKWHRCTVHNVVVMGHSDHSKPTFDCTCPKRSNDESVCV